MAGLISQVDPNKTQMASTLDVGNEETQMKSSEIPQATPLVSAANAQPSITTQSDNINVNTQDGASAPDMSTAVEPSPEIQAPMTTEEQAQETMKGVDAIIGSDSALMERAALQGQQQAASRGLGNSSFGARAAQSAVYDAAIPLATQAADIAAGERMLDRQAEIDRLTQLRDQAWQSGESDLARQLERELTDQNEQLQRDLEKSKQDWQTGENELGRQFERDQEKSRQDWQSGESQLDREQQERIADKEADLRKLLQEDAQQFDLDMADINKEHAQLLQTSQLASSIMEGHYNRLTEIYSNPELDSAQQNAAMANLTMGLNNSLAALQGMMNTDIGKYLPGLPSLEDSGGGNEQDERPSVNPIGDSFIPIPEDGSNPAYSGGGWGSNRPNRHMN